MEDFVPVCGLRRCTKCLEIKIEEDDFSFRNRAKGQRVAVCKTCVKKASNAWYQNNKDRHRENGKRSGSVMRWHVKKRDENKTLLVELKSKPCLDCGVSYPPWIMQFDHRDALLKKGNLATMAHNAATREAILEEAGKCDVVCANCHSDRTYKRRTETCQ